MTMPPVFVINLDKSPERMATIAKRLDKLDIPFERISGVYGADLSEEEMRVRKSNWKIPEPKENRGVLAKYAKLVSSASLGAITDQF